MSGAPFIALFAMSGRCDKTLAEAVAAVKLPALRDRRRGRSRGRDRVAMDGVRAGKPIAGGSALEGGRAILLSHSSRKRRGLDGARRIEGEPEMKNLTGQVARSSAAKSSPEP